MSDETDDLPEQETERMPEARLWALVQFRCTALTGPNTTPSFDNAVEWAREQNAKLTGAGILTELSVAPTGRTMRVGSTTHYEHRQVYRRVRLVENDLVVTEGEKLIPLPRLTQRPDQSR